PMAPPPRASLSCEGRRGGDIHGVLLVENAVKSAQAPVAAVTLPSTEKPGVRHSAVNASPAAPGTMYTMNPTPAAFRGQSKQVPSVFASCNAAATPPALKTKPNLGAAPLKTLPSLC